MKGETEERENVIGILMRVKRKSKPDVDVAMG